jgi:hypothetical protein
MSSNKIRTLTILALLGLSSPVIAGHCGGSHNTNMSAEPENTAAATEPTESEAREQTPLPAEESEPASDEEADTVDV